MTAAAESDSSPEDEEVSNKGWDEGFGEWS